MSWDSEAEMYEAPPSDLSRINRRQTVLAAINAERNHQEEKWGPQSYGNGTGPTRNVFGHAALTLAGMARDLCDVRAERGEATWLDILLEEVFEAAAEDSQTKLRSELVQVAAVCAAWVEDIDARG